MDIKSKQGLPQYSEVLTEKKIFHALKAVLMLSKYICICPICYCILSSPDLYCEKKTLVKNWVFLPRLSEAFPPERAPKGRAPVGVRPFNWRTDSDSSLKNKTK